MNLESVQLDHEASLEGLRHDDSSGRTAAGSIQPIEMTKPSSSKPSKNLGKQLIWMLFITFTFTKMAVLWVGQTYARTDEEGWGWLLAILICAVVANFGFFLWRNRHHQD